VTAVEDRIAEPDLLAPAPPRVERRRLSRTESLAHALTPRARGAQVVAVGALLVLWEIVGRITPAYIFAPPTAVARALVDLAGSGDLTRAIVQSVSALLVGYAITVVVGTSVGVALGWWRLFGRALDPIVAGLYVVPVAALVPLVVAWAGIDLLARVLVVVLFSILDVVLAAQAGVRNVDPAMVDVARTFGAGRTQLLRRIVLPSSVPFLFVGYRIAASRAVKGMVLGEMLFAASGLGGLVIRGSQAYRIDRVLAVVVVISLIGVGLTAAVRAVERTMTRWLPDNR
jgi:ABC-type nitrate/sulfonate/bicarbonate transport system permease component